MKKGPLLVYNCPTKQVYAFRNIPGLDICHVERLNLLKLAPGGLFGRLIIWTEEAFKSLNKVYFCSKKNYELPISVVTNSDINGIINSEQIQMVLNPLKEVPAKINKKFNPLKNKLMMRKLNP